MLILFVERHSGLCIINNLPILQDKSFTRLNIDKQFNVFFRKTGKIRFLLQLIHHNESTQLHGDHE